MQSTEEKLASLIKAFALNKAEASDLKEVCDRQNAEIKEIMVAENLNTYSTDEYTATYVIKQNTKVDEERLLEVLRKSGKDFDELGVIQTKEYVDAEALELAIFNGVVSQDLLAEIKSCSTVTPVPTLTVKRRKK